MIHALMLLAVQGAGDCPSIRIQNWGSEHLTGSFFVATIEPEPSAPLSYRWSATKGDVRPNAANPRQVVVEVDLGELMKGDVQFELALDVGGLPAGCPHRASLQMTIPWFEPLPDRPLPLSCPAMRLETQSDKIGMIQHRLVLDPMPKGTLTYDWRVSTGTILQGQGTPVIAHKIDPLEFSDQILTYNLNVIVGGLPEGCPPAMITALEIGAPHHPR